MFIHYLEKKSNSKIVTIYKGSTCSVLTLWVHSELLTRGFLFRWGAKFESGNIQQWILCMFSFSNYFHVSYWLLCLNFTVLLFCILDIRCLINCQVELLCIKNEVWTYYCWFKNTLKHPFKKKYFNFFWVLWYFLL